MADANPYDILKVDLSGQTAVVTGASQGLGKAIAIALAKSGREGRLHRPQRRQAGGDGRRDHRGRRPGGGVSLRREGTRRGRQADERPRREVGQDRHPRQQRRRHPRHAAAA